MAKQAYVYSGTDWVPLASEVTNLTTYQTKATTGLVLLNTTSFSGVSSQIISNVFSATYDNYEIVFNNISATGDMWMSMQLRAGSTTETSANYLFQSISGVSTTASAARTTGLSSWLYVHYITTAANSNCSVMRISNPFIAKPTSALTLNTVNISATASAGNDSRAWGLNTNTSYDGFVVAGGTFTGSISVYGYNK